MLLESTLFSAPQGVQFKERRQSERTLLFLPAWMHRAAAPRHAIAVRLFDKSDGGIGFISPWH